MNVDELSAEYEVATQRLEVCESDVEKAKADLDDAIVAKSDADKTRRALRRLLTDAGATVPRRARKE